MRHNLWPGTLDVMIISTTFVFVFNIKQLSEQQLLTVGNFGLHALQFGLYKYLLCHSFVSEDIF